RTPRKLLRLSQNTRDARAHSADVLGCVDQPKILLAHRLRLHETNATPRAQSFGHEGKLAHGHDVVTDERGETRMIKGRNHRGGATSEIPTSSPVYPCNPAHTTAMSDSRNPAPYMQ